jgi:hypothetical protein
MLKKYNISTRSPSGAVQDVTNLKVSQQRKLLKELFPGLKVEYPNKKYLIELTLKYLIDEIVRGQRTTEYTDLDSYSKAVNKAKRMGKESIYARFILAGQKKTKRKLA